MCTLLGEVYRGLDCTVGLAMHGITRSSPLLRMGEVPVEDPPPPPLQLLFSFDLKKLAIKYVH